MNTARKLRVLYVDDDAMVANMVRSTLVKSGHSVMSVTDPEQAWDLFESDPYGFDVVVTDQVMPKIKGEHLSLWMTQLRPSIPVIMVSGYDNELDQVVADSDHLAGFFRKPVPISELSGLIIEVAGKSRPGSHTY